MQDQIVMDDTPNGAPTAEAPAPFQSHPDVEALVAKCVAPVKKDFLRPPPVRTTDSSSNSNDKDKAESQKETGPAPVIKEKKSKRQLKRERREVRFLGVDWLVSMK